MCMKWLLAPLILLFLGACQPSELDRCIEANLYKNDYKNKKSVEFERHEILANFDFDIPQNERIQEWSNIRIEFLKSLNPLEEAIDDCVDSYIEEKETESWLREKEIEALTDVQDYKNDKFFDSILYDSMTKELKDLIQQCSLKIKEEFKETDTSNAVKICNSQGIY